MIKLLVTDGMVDYNHMQLKELLKIESGDNIITISPELFAIIEGSIILLPAEFSSNLRIYKEGRLLELYGDQLKPCSPVTHELMQEFKSKLGLVDYDYILNTILDMLSDDCISLRQIKNYISEHISGESVEDKPTISIIPHDPSVDGFLEGNKTLTDDKSLNSIARKLMDLKL